MKYYTPSSRHDYSYIKARVVKLLFLICILPPVNSGKNKQPSIIVIGAGVSGIAAATRLIENGFTNLKILEAENRIGGRIHSVKTGNVTVDLGAHWVGGEGGNTVYDMAAPLGLLDNGTKDYSNELTVFSDKEELYLGFLNYMSKQQDEIFNVTILADRNDSLYDFMFENVSPLIKSMIRDKERAETYAEWVLKIECIVDGCDSLKDVSAKGVNAYIEDEGSPAVTWKGKGYISIIDLLLKRHEKSTGPPINLDDILHLNKEVTSISKDNGILVKCKDGSSFTADLVIVTVSLGVLKADHETLFQPQLPEYKKRTIKGLGIGTVDRIALRFPDIWWENITGFELVWMKKDKPAETDKSHWENEIVAVSAEDYVPSVLNAWISGEAARKMESEPIENVKKRTMKVLRRFLSHRYNIPEPLDILRSTWGTNPHFRGSYSYRSMASEALEVYAADLAQPITDGNGKQVIFFAGEATSSTHYGSVHGALETGWREADRIIKSYKK